MKPSHAVCFLALVAGAGLVRGQEPPAAPLGSADAPAGMLLPDHPSGPGCEVGPEDNGVCGPPGRFWARGEYLLWWTKSSPLPPLITTSPLGTPDTQAGVLGLPTTTNLFGGSDVSANPRSGGRLTLGSWLDDQQTWGLEGNLFGLEDRSVLFSAASGGDPILARPFFNTEKGREDALLIAFPGVVHGQATIALSSQDLWGAEAYLRKNVCCGCCYRVDLLAGYRFLSLREALAVNETEITSGGVEGVPAGIRFDLNDRFDAYNRFHGGEVGVDAELRHCRFFVDLLGKVALGSTTEHVNILGNTALGGGPPLPGGFLAAGTNIGNYRRSRFGVVPEADLTLGYQVTDHLRASVGYTFLYWSRVARPGDQVDLAVNPSQVPPGTLVGTPRPAFAFHDTDFWAQGINFGLEFRY